MGQVRKRGKFYQIRYYRNGQRIEESTGFTKHDEARDLLKKREGAIADGVPITAKSTRLTFDDAVKDVIADYTVNAKKSKEDLERRITLHLTPVFGGRQLNAITTADMRAFAVMRLGASASNAEINRELAIVKRAFRLSVEGEKYFGRVPKIPMLKEAPARTGFFDDEMIGAVMGHLPAALRPVVQFAYVTGWRVPSEVLPLEWRQVDRTAWIIRLDPGTTKNGRGRVVDLSSHAGLVDVLGRLWAEHEGLQKVGTISPYVFQRRGKRIKDLRSAWEAATKAAGYPGKLLHDLRRSAVRNLVRAGVPDTVAMKITGHQTRSVFDRYDISSDADVREGLGRLEGTKRGDNHGQAKQSPAQQTA